MNTPSDKVMKLIRDGCQLSSPHLIISIIGGTKHFTMSAKLRKNFQQGLIQVAIRTSELSFNEMFLFFDKRYLNRCMDYYKWK